MTTWMGRDVLESADSRYWKKIGFPAQIFMLIDYLVNWFLYSPDIAFDWGEIISNIGAALFLWNLIILYIIGYSRTKLITSGLFKYTRHPMYLGLFLMNVIFWQNDFNSMSWHRLIIFCLLQVMFLINMVVAGYCQEQETLARFGKSAEDYYARTPRIPFLR